MAESSRENQPTKPESEKKPPETVLLTSEELRAIAGGASPSPGDPAAQNQLGKLGVAKKP